eukprot:Lithocolla_globosa_v1_NODE_4317_length_1465_cov_3.300709.p2 type:complete len:102 gc:universal NODE_4317_length_1465_cov_3.300709:1326-1021(-)
MVKRIATCHKYSNDRIQRCMAGIDVNRASFLIGRESKYSKSFMCFSVEPHTAHVLVPTPCTAEDTLPSNIVQYILCETLIFCFPILSTVGTRLAMSVFNLL